MTTHGDPSEKDYYSAMARGDLSEPDRPRNEPEDRTVYLPIKVTYEGLADPTHGPYFKGLVQMSPAHAPTTYSISESQVLEELPTAGWHTHDEGVFHMRPVDESADGDIGPISGLTQRESDDFMEAIIPTADVSDEQISAALDHLLQSGQVAAVRALLDAQAAAHAAEVEAWRERALSAESIIAEWAGSELHGTVTMEYHNRMMNQAGAACEVLRAARDTASAEVEALRAEVERLRGEAAMLGMSNQEFLLRAETAEAEVARLSGPYPCCLHCAEDEGHADAVDERGFHSTSCLTCDRDLAAGHDAAVREALENAAEKLEAYRRGDLYQHVNRSEAFPPYVARSLDDCSWAVAQCRDKVRSLIPEVDLGVWTQEQVDAINERAARRAEALAPLIEGDADEQP